MEQNKPKTDISGLVKCARDLFDAAFKKGVKHGRYLEQQNSMQKPLTISELDALIDNHSPYALWIESVEKYGTELKPVIWCIGGYLYHLGWANGDNVNWDQYGRTWRCWKRRPIEREIKAAQWLD